MVCIVSGQVQKKNQTYTKIVLKGIYAEIHYITRKEYMYMPQAEVLYLHGPNFVLTK